MNKITSPFVMVIFGATGDLTARKLAPAIYSMTQEKFLPEKFYIVGFGRRQMHTDNFRDLIKQSLVKYFKEKLDGVVWEALSENIYYHQGVFEEKAPYEKLGDLLTSFDRETKKHLTRYFYLATPPQYYSTILSHLDVSKLAEGFRQDSRKWTSVLIEKPFGQDADSARDLEKQLAKTFEEKQIYRIDHYLGKEAIQNIIAFRFANCIFEPLWNKEYIDHVQITMAETAGVAGRIGFYEGVGALRDVMQNHMLSMLSLVAMEQPQSFSGQNIHEARGNAVLSLKAFAEDEVDKFVVRGQYGKKSSKFKVQSSKFTQEKKDEIVSYRQEKGVDPKSNTETYVAMKVFLENERWKGVPWYLRTGKRLARDAVEISIAFKQTCHILFKEIGCPEEGNILTLRVSPNPGIGIQFIAKPPAHVFKLVPANMDFSYKTSFAKEKEIDAYEHILEEIFKGDQMLFNDSEEMKAVWRFINPILKRWEKNPPAGFPNYAAGIMGPKDGDELIKKDGRHWILK